MIRVRYKPKDLKHLFPTPVITGFKSWHTFTIEDSVFLNSNRDSRNERITCKLEDPTDEATATLSQDVRPEVPHHPWRVITEQRTSGWWPTKHDGQLMKDVGQVKNEDSRTTGQETRKPEQLPRTGINL